MNRTLLLALVIVSVPATSHALGFARWSVSEFIPYSISGNGTTIVGEGAQIQYLDMTSSTGTFTLIGGNTGYRPQVSNDGLRIGGTFTTVDPFTGNNYRQFGIYDRNTETWTSYGNLGYRSGTTASTGWGISGDGNTVLGQAYYNTTAQGTTGTRVNPVIGTVPLGTPTNLHPNTTNNGRVQGGSYDGTVVGGYAVGTAPGAIWVNGVEKLMQYDFGTGLASLAAIEDISNDGRYALGDGNSSTGGAFYIYDRINDTYTFGPNPYSTTVPTHIATMASISSDGRFVAGRYMQSSTNNNPFVNGKAFRYDTLTGSFDLLDDLAIAAGVDLQGFHLSSITGMSDDGTKFIGLGSLTTGVQTTTFYLDIAPVPEPATMSVLGLAAVAILRKRKKS